MATKIKDAATAERAALNLNQGIAVETKPGEPIAPKEKTTTERMFPEFVTDDGGIVNRPWKPYSDAAKPLPATATPEPPTQGQTPAPQAPTAPVYLKPEELTGKMVKLKVDGIEQDVPAESLIKTNQLERHLNAELMKLAEERRKVEDERRQFLSRPQIPEPQTVKPAAKKSPEVEALENRLQQMENLMAQQQQALQPAIEEAGKKRVAQMVKEKIGASDFDSYYEKIKEIAIGELSKPEVRANQQATTWFNSPDFAYQKYLELRVQDIKPTAPVPQANPNVPILQTQEGAPVIITNSGKPVNVPTLESSSGVPGRTSPDASWQSTYNALFERARQSNAQEDWMALYRHKIAPRE